MERRNGLERCQHKIEEQAKNNINAKMILSWTNAHRVSKEAVSALIVRFMRNLIHIFVFKMYIQSSQERNAIIAL